MNALTEDELTQLPAFSEKDIEDAASENTDDHYGYLGFIAGAKWALEKFSLPPVPDSLK